MWRSQRARKLDFNKAMDTKSDGKLTSERIENQKELFLEKLKNQGLKILMQETRLNDHEEKNDTQFKMHTLGMEDVKKDVQHLVGRVDQILIILTEK